MAANDIFSNSCCKHKGCMELYIESSFPVKQRAPGVLNVKFVDVMIVLTASKFFWKWAFASWKRRVTVCTFTYERQVNTGTGDGLVPLGI